MTVQRILEEINIKETILNATTAWAVLIVSNKKNEWNTLFPEPINKTEGTDY